MPTRSPEEQIQFDTILRLEQERQRRQYAGRGRSIETHDRHDGSLVVTVRHPDGMETHNQIDVLDIHRGRPIEMIARDAAHCHLEVYTRGLVEELQRDIFDQLRRALDPRRYGRSPAMEALRGMREGQRHMIDLMVGGVNYVTGAVESKPKKAEAIAALADYPKQIEEVGLVAVLLDDTMKLWQESADLGHCLYRSYTPRINAGDFIAYHVSGIKRSGYTVSFKMSSGTRVLFDPYRERKEKRWVHDQTRGKSNHTNDDPRLLSITGIILARINNVLDQKESVVTIEQTEPVPSMIIDEAASFGPEVLEMLDPLRRK